jgi:hypothetical protein
MSARVARRHLLLSAPALVAGALASGCKRRSETCPPSQLSAEDSKLRETLRYTDHSLDAAKVCNACQQFVPNPDADCGSCKLLKGFIHPAGSCTAFSPKG